MDIIQYLLSFIQYQHQQICWLFNFICRYIPLKQWAFDDSHSPKYQKFKIDELPVIKTFIKQDWQFLLEYYHWKYGNLKPVQRRNGKSIPEDTVCPLCRVRQRDMTCALCLENFKEEAFFGSEFKSMAKKSTVNSR